MLTTIGILTLIVVGADQAIINSQPNPKCVFFRNVDGYMEANCTRRFLQSIPANVKANVELLDLRRNYIGKLTNNSFFECPYIKILLLAFNQVHTIEAGSLAALGGLETLDLTQNAISQVPAGMPGSLVNLYLSNNPLTDLRNLDDLAGLRVLHLKRCDLNAYPVLVNARNLYELDVSDNSRITYVGPVQLAVTCRLTRLNVFNDRLFPDWRAGSHCRSRRLVEWALAHGIRVFGLGAGPKPLPADRDGGDDDPENRNCVRAPDEALDAFDTCTASRRAVIRRFAYAACAGFACLAVYAAWYALRLLNARTSM